MPRKIITAQKPVAHVLERHGPREQEGDFEVEQDEQNGHEVVAHVELHARVFEGLEAAFVGGVFCGVRAVGAEDVSQHLRHHADCNADQDEQRTGRY
jgi:hypothetical protein